MENYNIYSGNRVQAGVKHRCMGANWSLSKMGSLNWSCRHKMMDKSNHLTGRHLPGQGRQLSSALLISTFNPLRPNNDPSQTSHCNIEGLSVSEVTRI